MRKIAGSTCVVLLGLGQAISGWHSPTIGFGLMVVGLLLGAASVVLDERVRQRFPYVLVHRSRLRAQPTPCSARPPRGDLDKSLQQIEAYVSEVNRVMEEHGFGRNPGLVAATPSPPADVSLRACLQQQLERGRRIRATARITTDGACVPIEVWEQEVATLLEEAQRQDLVICFTAQNAGDLLRGVISGKWRTRARLDRELQTVSEFIQGLHE